jgi:O-antigen/teichoic acid export membrane protein
LNAPSVARGSALLFWAKVTGNAGFFVAVLILARALGPSGRGTIAFITVTALVSGRIAGLGVGEASAVFAARRADERPALLSNLVLFTLASAVVIGALACVLVASLGDAGPDGIGRPQLALLAGGALVTALAEAAALFLLGCGRIAGLALITAGGSWLYPLLLLALWATVGLSVTRAASAWVAGELLRSLLLIASSARGIGLARPRLEVLAEAWRFGVRAWVGSLARFLNFRTDQILMGFLASESALGVYAVAVNASEALLYLPAATATALIPLTAGANRERRLEETVRAFRSVAYVTMGAVLVAAAAGPFLLPIVFGEEFSPSVKPFLWLLPGALGFAATAVFSNALMAASWPGLSSLGPLVALVVGVALDFALIPSFGATGAAGAASAAFLAGGIAAALAYGRRSPFSWRMLVRPQRSDLDVLRALAGRA